MSELNLDQFAQALRTLTKNRQMRIYKLTNGQIIVCGFGHPPIECAPSEQGVRFAHAEILRREDEMASRH